MLLAYPYAGELMLHMPVGPAKSCSVSINTGFTGFKGVVCPEAAGKDAESKLKMCNAVARHADYGIFQFVWREKGGVVGK